MSESTVVIRVLKQILWILFIYTLLRFEFLVWNWSHWYSVFNFNELMVALLYGWRFDLSTTVTLSSILLIAMLLPWPGITKSIKSSTITITLALLHSPFLLFNALDVEFINFVGRRFSTDSLFLTQEVHGKWLALFSTYWPLFLFNIFLIVLFLWGHFRIGANSTSSIDFLGKKIKRIVISIGIVLISVVCARGGLQKKPLSIAHVTTDIHPKLVQLALNSSFTFLQSTKKSSLKMVNTYDSFREFNSTLNAPRDPQESYLQEFQKLNNLSPHEPMNVMVILLESFSYEYFDKKNTGDKQLTPFLSSLAAKGLRFKNAYAGGRRSIEAPVSIFMGIPSLMDEPFVTSQYSTVETPKIINEYKKAGYSSAFFHGGQNGTMFFDETAHRIGFEKYIGASEYPHANDNDGVWGIWDEPFLQWTGSQIKAMKQPFVIGLFTLSSHHPFKVPEKYEGKFPKGTTEIHQTIAYTDFALEQFFKSIESEPWFKNTLFIFTADHTSKSTAAEYDNDLGGFRVPLILYKANTQWPKSMDLDEPVQHIDILPTLNELIGNPDTLKNPRLARSLFRKGPRSAVLYIDNRYWLVKKDTALKLENDKISAFSLSENHLQLTPKELSESKQADFELIKELRGSIQYFNNSLIKGDLQLKD